MVKKVELHTHLEGSITPSLVKRLAKRNQLTLREGLFSSDESHFVWQDFMQFLDAYEEASQVIKAPIDYYDITYEYLKQCALEDTIYVEMMYSPEHAERASNIPSSEHVVAIAQAIDDAQRKYNITGRIIVTAVRHYGVASVNKVAKDAAREPHPYVVGFGMGGDEAGFPPGQFKRAYQIAHEAGLGCTTHAGEMVGPLGVIEALDNLPLSRLGHGVRAFEDKQLLQRIKEQNIHLEVCPGSNISLGVYASMEEHPFKKLFDLGLSVSLSSDDPPYFQTTVGAEYENAANNFGMSHEQLRKVSQMAIDAAFVDNETKARLHATLMEAE